MRIDIGSSWVKKRHTQLQNKVHKILYNFKKYFSCEIDILGNQNKAVASFNDRTTAKCHCSDYAEKLDITFNLIFTLIFRTNQNTVLSELYQWMVDGRSKSFHNWIMNHWLTSSPSLLLSKRENGSHRWLPKDFMNVVISWFEEKLISLY